MLIKEYPLVRFERGEESDLVFAEFIDIMNVDLKTAIEIVHCRLDFTANKEHYLVADMSQVREVTSQAKEFMQDPAGGLKNILAAALIGSNPLSVLWANIFIKTPKNFPAKFFWNKSDAVQWINEQRHKNQNVRLGLTAANKNQLL